MKLSAAVIYGAGPTVFGPWGGKLTSYGMCQIRDKLRNIGVNAYDFNFSPVEPIHGWLNDCAKAGNELAIYSYSLGNTTSTFLASLMKIRLLFCVAMSEYAGRNNRAVDRNHVARACLVRGPGKMSDVIVKGFNEVRTCDKGHLLIPYDSAVQSWAVAEARKLLAS